MKLLVLGGTWFLGRVIVESAVERGDEVTTFNRGRTGVDIVGAEVVRGDREVLADLQRLVDGREWDAVIDTSGMIPAVVSAAVTALNGRAASYVFASTVSVYTGWPDEPLTEDSEVYDCSPDADRSAIRPLGRSRTGYGIGKAGAERAVRERFDGRAVILRPGVILGPHEYVGRLPWWLNRAAQGGPMLAPGDARRGIQPIDVRDVASFILNAVDGGVAGTFNQTAPKQHATMGGLLRACVEVTGGGARPVWVDSQFLIDGGVKDWTELPLWRPAAGVWEVDSARAQAAGLACRSISETVADTWAWLRSGDRPVAHRRQDEHGIAPEKEQHLLALWQQRLA